MREEPEEKDNEDFDEYMFSVDCESDDDYEDSEDIETRPWTE